MIKKTLIAVLALGLAPLAFGQGMGGGMGMGLTAPFADVDADGDGNVTQEELGKLVPEQVVERLFTAWDTDESGGISEEEYNNRAAGGAGMGMGG
jgi:hypothetical protein